MTQGNRANLFVTLADAEPDDRMGWLRAALVCALEAHALFRQLRHGPYAERATRLLWRVKEAVGDAFPTLWHDVTDGQMMPDWLFDPE